MKSRSFKESDLYKPIAHYLKELGYTVRGEVKDCDITAIKGDSLIIIELKRNFSTDLLAQATHRQRASQSVYMAIPKPKYSLRSSKWKGIRRLTRRLELGLIFVDMDKEPPLVQVAIDPAPYTRQRSKKAKINIIEEIEGRSLDLNKGGVTHKKIMTAYKESALLIAYCLHNYGPMSAANLVKLGTAANTHSILYNNFYKWFYRESRGIYAITNQGKEALKEYQELIDKHLVKLLLK